MKYESVAIILSKSQKMCWHCDRLDFAHENCEPYQGEIQGDVVGGHEEYAN